MVTLNGPHMNHAMYDDCVVRHEVFGSQRVLIYPRAVHWSQLVPGDGANINRPNLEQNIEPTRERAQLVIRKGHDHHVTELRLRKL